MLKKIKFIKAYCSKTKNYYGLELAKEGSEWKVVNFDALDKEKAKVMVSLVMQDKYYTADNLLPCSRCGSRLVAGCNCAERHVRCRADVPYNFDCLYCKNLVIDYSFPSQSDIRSYRGDKIMIQGKEVKLVDFGNVKWEKFDKIQVHPNGRTSGYPFEPTVHVETKKTDIEFHGYNISEMNEGVCYEIGAQDDFIIECDVDTSTIRPHPGGYLYVSFGLITANIALEGGSFLLGGKEVAKVGSRFKMRLSVTDGGTYEIIIDGKKRGEQVSQAVGKIPITFGFAHGAHHCSELSHAYLKDIKMIHGEQQ